MLTELFKITWDQERIPTERELSLLMKSSKKKKKRRPHEL